MPLAQLRVGKATLAVLKEKDLGGAQEAQAVYIRFLKVVHAPLRQRLYRFRVGRAGPGTPTHGDPLEVLGGHHGAHTSAPIGPVGVVDERAEADPLLAGWKACPTAQPPARTEAPGCAGRPAHPG